LAIKSWRPTGEILEHDVLVPVAGQSDHAEEQHEQFKHGSIVM
jgi:hypothetical protein